MPDLDLYFDREPDRYTHYLWRRALDWWESGPKKRCEEQLEMFHAKDRYIEARRRSKRTALSFPIIFAHIEARNAVMLEVLSTNEPLTRFEPKVQGDVFSKVSGERLEAAFQNIRNDLDWDTQYMNLMQGTDVHDWMWVCIEPQELIVTPETGIFDDPGYLGTYKTYPSFGVYGPGRVLVDGYYDKDEQIPAKFKTAYLPYHELKRRFPEQVGSWIKRHIREREQVDTIPAYQGYRKDYPSGGAAQQEEGFLLVEAHMEAEFSDGNCYPIVAWFLPQVSSKPDGSGAAYGYFVDWMPKPYLTVNQAIFHARGRPLFDSPRGKGTADLLVPFQREFSDAVSSERDAVRLALAPPMAMRSELWAGQERPSMAPWSVWPFVDKGSSGQYPLDYFAKPIHTSLANLPASMENRQMLMGVMELISAASEAQTGGQDNSANPTATAFAGRSNAGHRRIMVSFTEHAKTIIRINRTILAMMRETPQIFLNPNIAASAAGTPGVLSEYDIQAAVSLRVPALSEYANREYAKVMWRMAIDGMAQMPIFQASPGMQLLAVQDILRSMRVGEMRLQEYTQMALQAIMGTAAANAGQPTEIGGGGGKGGSQNNPVPSAPVASPQIAAASTQTAGMIT